MKREISQLSDTMGIGNLEEK